MKTLVLGLAIFISIVEASSLKSFLGGTSNGFSGAGVMRMFMTSTTYNGNLGGSSGADAKCAARATAASLSGTYIALVSTSTLNAKNKFVFPPSVVAADVKNNIIFQGGLITYMDRGGGSWTAKQAIAMPFGKYYTDFNPTDRYIFNGLNYDEFGTAIAGVTRAWTGTDANGTAEAETCNNWTDGTAGFTGEYGVKNTTDGTWMTTNGTPVSCANVYRLICLQIN